MFLSCFLLPAPSILTPLLSLLNYETLFGSECLKLPFLPSLAQFISPTPPKNHPTPPNNPNPARSNT